jgi:hypothetical protein
MENATVLSGEEVFHKEHTSGSLVETECYYTNIEEELVSADIYFWKPCGQSKEYSFNLLPSIKIMLGLRALQIFNSTDINAFISMTATNCLCLISIPTGFLYHYVQ